jgi:hypothetical protein
MNFKAIALAVVLTASLAARVSADTLQEWTDEHHSFTASNGVIFSNFAAIISTAHPNFPTLDTLQVVETADGFILPDIHTSFPPFDSAHIPNERDWAVRLTFDTNAENVSYTVSRTSSTGILEINPIIPPVPFAGGLHITEVIHGEVFIQCLGHDVIRPCSANLSGSVATHTSAVPEPSSSLLLLAGLPFLYKQLRMTFI